jgi:protein ImuB
MRRVMYLYLPNWPIDRLRRSFSHTNLRAGSPADAVAFATVVAAGGRRLLAAVNPAAAAAGLAPGMPLADALSFLPGLSTAPAEPEADAAALVRLAQWCTRYSPWTAPDFETERGADGIKIEITGCAHLWGGEAALAADLARRLVRQGIDHRIAIAGTLGAAWALARFAAIAGQPALLPPDGEKAALAPLPVEALRLDPIIAAGLRRVGLGHIGDLVPMPRAALARRFGETVARRLDQALDALPEPLSPLGETPARRVRLSFAEPIADPADLACAIDRLTGDLTARLAREGQGVRRLGLAFHRVDGRVEEIRLGTARPSRDPQHLARLFIAKLETIDPGLGVEDMILALFAAEPLPAEQTGLSPFLNPPSLAGEENLRSGRVGANIAPLLDRLGARLGLDALSRIAMHESHIPERASVTVPLDDKSTVIPGRRAAANPESRNTRFEITDSGFASETRPGMTIGETGRQAAKPPRPMRLFAPPEPIEAVWLLPDDPPFRFTWRRRPYRVQSADGPERIADEWWVPGGSAAVDAIRDYYRVEDEEGRRFWLFRTGLPGAGPSGAPRWYVHGIFA